MFENNNNDMVSSGEVDKKWKALVSYNNNNNNNNKISPLDCWGGTCYVQLKIPFYYWCGTRSYRGIVTMTKLKTEVLFGILHLQE